MISEVKINGNTEFLNFFLQQSKKSSRLMKRKKSEVHENYSDKENVGSKKATRRIGRQHLNAAG